MNILQWVKFKKLYRKQVKVLQNKTLDLLVDETIKLYPETIDISDGELRSKKGFWSKNLSDAFHKAEDLNVSDSTETDFMIWAIYGELHTKSRENFSKGIKSVSVLELNRSKIIKRYIKDCSEANIY